MSSSMTVQPSNSSSMSSSEPAPPTTIGPIVSSTSPSTSMSPSLAVQPNNATSISNSELAPPTTIGVTDSSPSLSNSLSLSPQANISLSLSSFVSAPLTATGVTVFSASPLTSISQSLTTFMSGSPAKPTTSQYMFSSFGGIQPNPSLLVRTSTSQLEHSATQSTEMQRSSNFLINISPSPSQSPVMSTSAVVVATEEDAIFAAKIAIKQGFTSDLNNKTSPAFIALAKRVVDFLTIVYSSIPGFVRVEVNSFSNGSVVVDTRVIFESNSNVTTENITNSLENANITGNNSLEIIGVNVTRIEPMLFSSSSVYMSSSFLQTETSIATSTTVLQTSAIVLFPTSFAPKTQVEPTQSLSSSAQITSLVVTISSASLLTDVIVSATPLSTSMSPSLAVQPSNAPSMSTSELAPPTTNGVTVSIASLSTSMSPSLQANISLSLSSFVSAPPSSPGVTVFSASPLTSIPQSLTTSMSGSPAKPTTSPYMFSSFGGIQPSPSLLVGTSTSQLEHSATQSTEMQRSSDFLINISPFPSQSPVMSTSAVVVATKENAIFAAEIAIKQVFTNDLNNKTSPAFIALAKRVVDFLTIVYSSIPGFVRVEVNSFSNGSVVADTRVIFESSSNVTTENITNSLESANITGNNSLEIIGVNVTRIEPMLFSSSSVYMSSSFLQTETSIATSTTVLQTSANVLFPTNFAPKTQVEPTQSLSSSTQITSLVVKISSTSLLTDVIASTTPLSTSMSPSLAVQPSKAPSMSTSELAPPTTNGVTASRASLSTSILPSLQANISLPLSSFVSVPPTFPGVTVFSASPLTSIPQSLTTSMSGSPAKPTTSPYMFSSFGGIQPSPSLLVGTSTSQLEHSATQSTEMQRSSDFLINISPSPSQSPVMSTSAVVVAPEENAIFAAEIAIKQVFTNDLNNKTSPAFIALAKRVVDFLTIVYSSIPGFVRAEVNSFSNGSVVADTRVIFESNSNVTTENITNSLESANITGNNSLEIIGVNVTRIEPMLFSSSSVYMSSSFLQTETSIATSTTVLQTSANVFFPTNFAPKTQVEPTQSLSSSTQITSLVVKISSTSLSTDVIASTTPLSTSMSPSLAVQPSKAPSMSTSELAPPTTNGVTASRASLSTSILPSLQANISLPLSSFVSVPPTFPGVTVFSASPLTSIPQSLTTSMSGSPAKPTTSPYMFSSFGGIQPSPSLLVGTSTSQLEHSATQSTEMKRSSDFLINISSSPSQSPVMSTSAVVVATKENAIFAAEIAIKQVFTNDLNNKTSPAFIALAKRVVDFCTIVYSSIPGFVRVEVNSFSNGSVVADTRVIFESSSNVTTENITNSLESANITGNNSLEIIGVNVTRIEPMLFSSSSVYMSSSFLQTETSIATSTTVLQTSANVLFPTNFAPKTQVEPTQSLSSSTQITSLVVKISSTSLLTDVIASTTPLSTSMSPSLAVQPSKAPSMSTSELAPPTTNGVTASRASLSTSILPSLQANISLPLSSFVSVPPTFPGVTVFSASPLTSIPQSLTTSMSGSPAKPTTSPYMFSSFGGIQPSPSLLVGTSTSQLEPSATQSTEMQRSSDFLINISPSPSQSPVMSTSAVVVAPEENAIFAAEIAIKQVFTNDLNNKTSPAFISLAKRVVDFCTIVYLSIPGFVRVEVNSFSNGSVVADTRVIFESNSNVTTENITNSLESANITGNNSLEIIGVNVTRIELMFLSSSSVYMSSSLLQTETSIATNTTVLQTSANVLFSTTFSSKTQVEQTQSLSSSTQITSLVATISSASLLTSISPSTADQSGVPPSILSSDAAAFPTFGVAVSTRSPSTSISPGVVDPDDGRFETWIIVLTVCFSLVFIILIGVSLLVSKILYCTNPV